MVTNRIYDLQQQVIPLTLFGINEPQPGARWQALFQATWPAYRRWYFSAGERPDRQSAQAELAKHMPELMSTYHRLVALTGDDPAAARMLTLWDPPRFLPGCSQVALTLPEPILCRNYDYAPELLESVVYSSQFTKRKVIGMGDCLWGLLDGMNDSGLAVSLAYGGLPGSKPGFAIPIVVRYLLEVADDVEQACEILKRLPISMSYNLTMVDTHGAAVTAFVAPDRDPEFRSDSFATNQRCAVPDYPKHAARFRSSERREFLADLSLSSPDPNVVAKAFLADPLYSRDYKRAFGTLYTALYRPADGRVDYIWPDRVWSRSFDDPDEIVSVDLRGG